MPAPDVNTDGEIIDWMVDEYEQVTGDLTKASFTGKTLANGGSEGRLEATGRGGVIALREYCKARGIQTRGLRVSMQGVGNVGFHFAAIAQKELGVHIVALADIHQTLMSDDAEGFDFRKAAFAKGGIPQEFSGVTFASSEITRIECEVLVLAALGDVINESNHAHIQANTVLELANGPVDFTANELLVDRDVGVIPDVIANAGGVAVSFLEWQQNIDRTHWSKSQVNVHMDKILTDAMHECETYARKNNCSLKKRLFPSRSNDWPNCSKKTYLKFTNLCE